METFVLCYFGGLLLALALGLFSLCIGEIE